MNFETGEISELEPEFCHMSLKPGIGHDWLRLYWPEVIQGERLSRVGMSRVRRSITTSCCAVCKRMRMLNIDVM